MEDILPLLVADIETYVEEQRLRDSVSQGSVFVHGESRAETLRKSRAYSVQLEKSITLWMDSIIRYHSGATVTV